MNIYAKPGIKVVWTGPTTPFGSVCHNPEEHLEVDKEYTVFRTEVHSCHTHVYLTEVPNIPFNSVQFEEVD